MDWKTVDEAAKGLGVADATRYKWRQRGVPAKWQISIIEKLSGEGKSYTFDDFKALQLKPGHI